MTDMVASCRIALLFLALSREDEKIESSRGFTPALLLYAVSTRE